MTSSLSDYRSLCIFWKILGVCPLGLNLDGTFDDSSAKNACYPLLLTVTFGVLISRELFWRLSCILPGETLISMSFGILCTFLEYGVICGAWLNIGLRPNLISRIVETFKRVRTLINSLELPTDVSINTVLRHIKFRILLVNIGWMCLYLLSLSSILYYNCFDSRIRLIANIPRVVTHNVFAIFIYAMRLGNALFFVLNANIKRRLRRMESAAYFVDDESITLEFCAKSNEMDFFKIGEIHERLNSLVNMTTRLLSLPIMLNLFVNYIQISTILYTCCVLFNNLQFTSWLDVGISVRWVGWLLIHIFELLVTINVCDTVTREANRSVNILHGVFLSDCFENYKQQVTISLKLLQLPLQVQIHGLQLNSALLVTMFGSITTYMVIMMQLDEQTREGSMNIMNRVQI